MDFKTILSFVLLLLCIVSATNATPTARVENNTVQLNSTQNCSNPCGCNNLYYYDKIANRCQLVEHLKKIMRTVMTMIESYVTEDRTNVVTDDSWITNMTGVENTTLKATTSCDDLGECVTIPECSNPCGCDNLYYYVNASNKCQLNLTHLREIMVEKYNTQDHLREKAENIFEGIFVAIYIFLFCASLCIVSACLYCCHLNYSDRRLKNDVKALTAKLNRDGKLLNKSRKKPIQAIAESCNVCVEDAGVFVC